ncbi:MAG TPA: hypothetical protein VJR29_09690 [bacterium]|nr:hypothetical protein [bacterium]
MDVQAPPPRFVANPESEKLFGKAAYAELESLSRERDAELQREGLFSLASRLEGAGREEAAHRLYALLPDHPKAEARKAALEGRGNFGAAFETQLRRLSREIFQPQAILPMAAGSAVYGLARGALLGRLLANPRAALWTRGLGARGAAAGGAFLAEVPAFTISSRALHRLAGSEAGSSWGGDLGRSALTLGLFKSFGAAGQWAARGGNLPPALAGQAAIFTGLLAAHRLEEKIGLRPEVGSGAVWGEVLGSMLSLNLGSRLGQSLLGSRYARFRRELDLRAATSRPLFGNGPESFSPALGLAGAGRISPPSMESAKLESTIAQSRGGSASSPDRKAPPDLRRLQKLINHELLTEAWEAFPQFKELKSQFTPREFRIIAAKLGPLFEDTAMMRRAYAFIFLDRLVPGLSHFQRMKQLARIDRGFQDEGTWVRELAIQAFDHNAAFWPRSELARRIPDLDRLSRDPEERVRQAAFRGLVRMTEFLEPAQRVDHLKGLALRFARSGDVDHFKALPTARALRSLQPPERLQVVKLLERALPRHEANSNFIPFFGDMIFRLEPSAQAGRLRALERLYRHSDPLIQVDAMTAVDNNMDKLPRKSWPGRIWHFESMLGSPEARIRERAVTILGGLLSSEPGFLDARRIGNLRLRLLDSEPQVRRAALTAHERIASALDAEGRREILQFLVQHWTASRGRNREPIAESLREIYLGMKARERKEWMGGLMEDRQHRPLPPGLAAAFAEP